MANDQSVSRGGMLCFYFQRIVRRCGKSNLHCQVQASVSLFAFESVAVRLQMMKTNGEKLESEKEIAANGKFWKNADVLDRLCC